MAFFHTLPKETSAGEMIGQGFGQGLGSSLQQRLGQFFDERKKERSLSNFFESEYGQSLSDENKSLITGFSKGLLPPQALTKALSQENPEVEKENFEIMKDAFGERFAKIWKATGQGERTSLTNAALDARLRGYSIEDLLSTAGLGGSQEASTFPEGEEVIGGEEELVTPQGEAIEKESVAFPTYRLDTSGQTPKDINTYKGTLRKENTKPFQEATSKAKSSEAELRSIRALYKLNESRNLPETFGQQLGQGVNPFTGNLAFPRLAKTETEVFDKTIKDFTTKAKDSFGARVTNFELGQFLARLPRLINSYEGRKMITEQMEIVTELNALYNQSLRDVYQHYGLGNITQEDAERIAERRIAGKSNSLISKYDRIADRISGLESSSSESNFNYQTLPNAREFTGKTFEDEKGNNYKSTGKGWRKL